MRPISSAFYTSSPSSASRTPSASSHGKEFSNHLQGYIPAQTLNRPNPVPVYQAVDKGPLSTSHPSRFNDDDLQLINPVVYDKNGQPQTYYFDVAGTMRALPEPITHTSPRSSSSAQQAKQPSKTQAQPALPTGGTIPGAFPERPYSKR